MASRPLPAEYQALKDNPNLIIDVHGHVFNHNQVPNGYLGVRIPFTRRFLHFVEDLARLLWLLSKDKAMSGSARFVDMFSRGLEEILLKWMGHYPNEAIFCPLTMDMDYSIKGRVRYDFQLQIDSIIQLMKKYPNKLLPFLCMNPRNPNMHSYFGNAMCTGKSTYGFWGVKVYPNLGYSVTDPRLLPIYQKCEELCIPITVHCSLTRVHTTDKKFKIYHTKVVDGKPVAWDETKKFKTEDDYSNYFSHPRVWAPVLELYPELRLNFAHFGGIDAGWDEGIAWYMRAKKPDGSLLYPNLFTDVAYTIRNKNVFTKLQAYMKDPLIASRVMYGTDSYMVLLEGKLKDLKARFDAAMGPELVKIMQQNAKRFLFG